MSAKPTSAATCVAQAKVEDKLLEEDDTTDPRFAMTAAALEKQGIKDFQLDYAMKTIKRLAARPNAIASAASTKPSRGNERDGGRASRVADAAWPRPGRAARG